MIKLNITRDSVHPGDDTNAPHKLEIEVNKEDTLKQTLSTFNIKKYLPSVEGSTTWSIKNTLPIAIYSTSSDLEFLHFDDIQIKDLPHHHLHFCYHRNESPLTVKNILSDIL